MAIITLASWDWFKRFDGTKLKKRGDEYDELKSALGDAMLEQACKYVVLHLLHRAPPPTKKLLSSPCYQAVPFCEEAR